MSNVLTPEGATKSNDKRFQRINAGTGHWYKIDGTKADGVTGIINGAVPKNLTGWAAGTVAELICDDPQRVLDDIKRYGRDGFIEMMKKQPFKERDEAANKGTAVHKLAERLAMGEEVEVPDYLAGHVDAFLSFRKLYNPTKEMLEVSCFNLKYRYGGTLDSWAHLEILKSIINDNTGKPYCDCPDECLSLIDIKTNRSGPFGEVGLQLAAYGGCNVYIDAAGEIRPMPKFAHYFVLWLRSDGFELIPFWVNQKDWKSFLYAQQVSHFTDWKKGRVASIKGAAVPIPKAS